jgi:hypothetical protein
VVSSHEVGFAVGHPVYPGLHATVQPPGEQAGCPLVVPGQTRAQAPQLSGSCASSTHAVGLAVGQPEYPELHLNPHTPAVQAGWPLAIPAHASPQVLQFLGSLVVSTHAPVHRVGVGAWQPLTHP